MIFVGMMSQKYKICTYILPLMWSKICRNYKQSMAQGIIRIHAFNVNVEEIERKHNKVWQSRQFSFEASIV